MADLARHRRKAGRKFLRAFRLLLVVPFLLALRSYSQTGGDSIRVAYVLSPDSNAAALHFERNLNTYLWNLRADYALRDTLFRFSLHDKSTSSFIKQTDNSIRNEQNFFVDGSRTVSRGFSIDAEATSYFLSDNQSLGVSDAALHTGLAGVSYEPFPFLSVSPMLGFRYDRQGDRADEGLNGRLSAQFDTIDGGGYATSGSLRLNESNIAPREYRNNAAQLFFRKDFLEGSLDSLRLTWSDNRWDFYVPADSAIENQFGTTENIRTRVDDILNISNSLNYGVGNNLSAVIQTLFENRSIANTYRYKSLSEPLLIPYDVTVQEERLEGGIELRYQNFRSVTATAGINYSERDEKHVLSIIEGVDKNIQANKSETESQLDNTARRTLLHGSLLWSVSPSDLLSFESSAGLLRYDTPDSLNTDDRDELLINEGLRETHRWNGYLESELQLDVTLNHTVYIFSDRSANNNWNRIFRLSPVLTYTPSGAMKMVNAFEVLANYTVFDFESVIPTVESYSYRQFAFLDTTSYDMTRAIGLDMYFQLRLYERGELHWREFTERPQQYFQEATFSPDLRYTIEGTLVCAVGFRSFAQKRYQYDNGERVPNGSIFSYGPTTSIALTLSRSSRLEMQGWEEFQEETGLPTREISNVTMTVKAFF